MKVGFIGLGAMGVPMALNLLKAGHAVRGFDVRAGAAEGLVQAGGSAATSAGSGRCATSAQDGWVTNGFCDSSSP